MLDEHHPDVVCVRDPGVNWRVYELENCQKHLGLTVDIDPTRVSYRDINNCGAKHVIWKLHTEATTPELLAKCTDAANHITNAKHINDPRNWLACHAKDVAFRVWQTDGVPCPRYFEFVNTTDFFNRRPTLEYPLLMRLNNSTSGWFSWLVHNDDEARRALVELDKAKAYKHDGRNGTGVGRKFIAVQYIQTTRPEKVNMSFRIVVAGDRVVTGYARIGPAADWIAITNRFEEWMQEPFIKYQRMCQKFCQQNESLIVKAVHALGLNFQGVDVILDQNDQPYFLEVQPGFSVGYANLKSWLPPFYNPSKPEELRQFLIKSMPRLVEETPMYCRWLDKNAMFDTAFASLKAYLT